MSTPAIALNSAPTRWGGVPVPAADLARIGLGMGDELGDRLGRKRRMHHHDEGLADDGCDRRDIAHEIVIELVVKRCADDVRHASHEQGVTVLLRSHSDLGADIVAGARPVFTDKLLAAPLRQPLPDQAFDYFGRDDVDEPGYYSSRRFYISLSLNVAPTT